MKTQTLNISTVQKTSDGFYFVGLTDGSTAILPGDSKIIKEYKQKKEKKMEKIQRQHTKKQDRFIQEIKFKYITADSARKKEKYGKILSCISFF